MVERFFDGIRHAGAVAARLELVEPGVLEGGRGVTERIRRGDVGRAGA
ncbi:MAG: hypothetical protein ABW039_01965 [Sphingobium sp.]